MAVRHVIFQTKLDDNDSINESSWIISRMKNKTDNIKRDTPIRDGDTRPDQNIEGESKIETKRKKASSPLANDRRELTKEGAADVNSLEDYKDAKS